METKNIFVLIYLFFILIGCKSKPKNENKKKQTVDTAVISGNLEIKLNQDSLKIFLKYSNIIDWEKPENKNPQYYCYGIDTQIIIKSTSTQLNEIFLTYDEDYFHSPFTFLYTKRVSDTNYEFNKYRVSNDFNSDKTIINIQDVNFDGFDDLILKNDIHNKYKKGFYDIWLYNPVSKKYILWYKSLKQKTISINKKNKQITFKNWQNNVEYLEQIKMLGKDTQYTLIKKENTIKY